MQVNESSENYLETILMLSKTHPVVRSVDIATELNFKKSSVSVAMKREEIQRLIRIAEEQMSHAYAPYSHFQVGAALLTAGGKVYAGCNIENAAYTPSNCAERTAFFKAVSEGERKFSAICIVGGMNGIAVEYTAPCGVCRQVMMEFCQPETFQIILAVDEENYKVCSLRELFPFGFGPDNLQERDE